LKIAAVEFVIADVGLNLQWIIVEKCYEFWKSEVTEHLADDLNKIFMDEFPGNYAYISSLWKGGTEGLVILIEKFH
jgi:hypothetical protein